MIRLPLAAHPIRLDWPALYLLEWVKRNEFEYIDA